MAEKRKFEKSKETKPTKKPKIVYTAEEEDWLVKNVLVYRAIIENKKTDGATNRDKDKAWVKVTNAFNLTPPGQERTQKSLREKYQKIKHTLKDRVFYFSNDAKQSGGGGGPTKKEQRQLNEPLQNSHLCKTESEQKQQHLEAKHRIEIEILEFERERYKFERERADLNRKQAAFDLERAELDRDRSAIELEWAKNKLLYDKELHRLTLQRTSDHMQT